MLQTTVGVAILAGAVGGISFVRARDGVMMPFMQRPFMETLVAVALTGAVALGTAMMLAGIVFAG